MTNLYETVLYDLTSYLYYKKKWQRSDNAAISFYKRMIDKSFLYPVSRFVFSFI